jgi:hypothetical protein
MTLFQEDSAPGWVEMRLMGEIRKLVIAYSNEIDFLNRTPDPEERRLLKCSENGKTIEKFFKLFCEYRRIFLFNEDIPWADFYENNQ